MDIRIYSVLHQKVFGLRYCGSVEKGFANVIKRHLHVNAFLKKVADQF